MRKTWKCDFKECDEPVQWYRRYKGELLKLCTKHYADLARRHWGRSVDSSELDKDDIRYLEGKERKEEFAKKKPFEVRLFSLEDGTTKVRIRDRRTGERRSFVVKGTDEKRRFDETHIDLERKRIPMKLSIDDYVKRLRNSLLTEKKRE